MPTFSWVKLFTLISTLTPQCVDPLSLTKCAECQSRSAYCVSVIIRALPFFFSLFFFHSKYLYFTFCQLLFFLVVVGFCFWFVFFLFSCNLVQCFENKRTLIRIVKEINIDRENRSGVKEIRRKTRTVNKLY